MSEPKYPKPKERGEKWKLWDDRDVIVLQRLRGGFVEVFNERGFIEAQHENQFRLRLDPPVEGDKHVAGNS
jgi:hypothetical protein